MADGIQGCGECEMGRRAARRLLMDDDICLGIQDDAFCTYWTKCFVDKRHGLTIDERPKQLQVKRVNSRCSGQER